MPLQYLESSLSDHTYAVLRKEVTGFESRIYLRENDFETKLLESIKVRLFVMSLVYA